MEIRLKLLPAAARAGLAMAEAIEGKPEQVTEIPDSYTQEYLRSLL